ncbi:hypothetical protein Barb6_03694 [Bacteroidales bacterium Barb6]|nr:hypothetical protein Barb6_03694 [Bacteroidales bacterium Barb6]
MPTPSSFTTVKRLFGGREGAGSSGLLFSIKVTPPGKTSRHAGLRLPFKYTVVILVCKNAYLPISVTLAGMVTLFRFSQNQKAVDPIEVTESGMTTFFRPVQFPKAPDPIEVTEPEKGSSVRPWAF